MARLVYTALHSLFYLLGFILKKLFFFLRTKPKKYINANGYVVLADINELEHRHIATQLLGRKLFRNECVHHVNGDKTNNRIANLCLMDREKHEHFHAWLRWKLEKNGKYPSINKQKKVLENEYSGTLLENIEPVVKKSDGQTSQKTTSETSGLSIEMQKQLMAELKTVREILAAENDVPLYMIFNNKTLEEMTNSLPTTDSELLQITGVGPVKLEQYGHYFIEEIKKFVAEIEEQKADPA